MATKKTNSSNSSPKSELGQGIDPGLITVQGRVGNSITQDKEVRISGLPNDSEMLLINKLSRNGNLDPSSLYVFDCVPSTQNVDSHFTRMGITSLVNYAQEAKLGTPLLNSHRSGSRGPAELPIGRSFNGTVENDPNNIEQQIFSSSAYLLRNNMANGSVNTNDIIAAIEAGTVSDISIGFSFSAGTPDKDYQDRTMILCSICGNDLLEANWWDDDPDTCHHWPGELYKSEGGKKSDLCVGEVVNAHLSEYSTVYQGATPGAIILKAQRAASEGKLDRSMVHRLEEAYHTRLIDYSSFPVPIIEAKQGEVVIVPYIAPQTIEPAPENKVEEVPNTERIEEKEMVDKRVLEDATKEGAKHALAELAKSLMGSRDFSDDELALFSQIETKLATGDVAQANSLLLRLMNPQLQESAEEGDFYEAGNRDAGEGEGEGEDGDGGEEERSGQTPESAPDLISFALTASERQQYRELEEAHNKLKKENKRLIPLANVGERAWTALIALTIRSYARAGLGNGEEIRGMLLQLPFDHVRTLRQQYEEIALRVTGQHDQDEEGNLILIGEGGRQSVPADANSPSFAQGVVTAIEQRRNDYGAYK